MEIELQSEGYSKIKKDPTAAVINKLDGLIRGFSDPVLKNSKVTNPLAPRAFGQIKIHKPGYPVRLIVNGRRSPLAALEKNVSSFLKKYLGRNRSYLKDSKQFVDILKDEGPLGQGETMVSLDVVKLFPSLPRDETLEAVNQELVLDNSVSETLRKEILFSVEFIHNSSYFVFNSIFYKQSKGSPIGSSLSPILAEIFMNFHEAKARRIVHQWPRIFLRYVDDHFVVVKALDLPQFLKVLNEVSQDITFTVEEPSAEGLPFLDVLVKPEDQGFRTMVYRKPTYSGVVIAPSSVHHPGQKSGVWFSLVNRAINLSSDNYALEEEMTFLKELARINGYSHQDVETPYLKIKRKERRQEEITLQRVEKEQKGFVVLPYLGPISTRVGSIISNVTSKRIGYIPLNKLGDLLFNRKDEIKERERSGVYKIYCKCGKSYVGRTARNFGKRLKEHQAAVRNFAPEASALAKHFWKEGCELGFDWSLSKVVSSSRHTQGIRYRELLEIALEDKVNPSGVMNDLEFLGRMDLWMSLAGSLLQPVQVKQVTPTDRDQFEEASAPGVRLNRAPDSLQSKLGRDETFSESTSPTHSNGARVPSTSSCLPVQPIAVIRDIPFRTKEKQFSVSQWSARLRNTAKTSNYRIRREQGQRGGNSATGVQPHRAPVFIQTKLGCAELLSGSTSPTPSTGTRVLNTDSSIPAKPIAKLQDLPFRAENQHQRSPWTSRLRPRAKIQ